MRTYTGAAGEVAEAVLNRIRKLQRLTRSSNEHEAALAATKMQELLFAHNLSLEVLRDPSEYVEERRDVGRRSWARRLLVSLCRNNFCQPLYDARTGQFILVGRRENVAAVNGIFVYLVGEIDRLAGASYRAYVATTPWPESVRTWSRAFRTGAVSAIQVRLESQRQRDVARVSAAVVGTETGTAIIRRLDADLQAEVARRYPGAGRMKGSTTSVRSRSGFEAGHAAGSRMSLSRSRAHIT